MSGYKDNLRRKDRQRITWRFRASGHYPRLKNGIEFFLFSPVGKCVNARLREAAGTLYASCVQRLNKDFKTYMQN
jgi:hypothetical protein